MDSEEQTIESQMPELQPVFFETGIKPQKPKKHISKRTLVIIIVLSSILFISAVGVGTWLITNVVSLANSVKNDVKFLTEKTPRMIPTINIGDNVIVEKIPIDEIKVGDIIAYTPNINIDYIMTGRIVNIEDEKGGKIFTTKGDANPRTDPPITENQIVGKVIQIIHKK